MTLFAVLVFAAGWALLSVGLTILAVNRSAIRRFEEEHREAVKALGEARDRLQKRSEQIDERLAERERALDLRAEALEERHAARERLWTEERAALLDRIQVPGAAAARAYTQALDGESDTPGDEQIDTDYQKQPESLVQWDADLEGIPGVDGDLAAHYAASGAE